MTTTSRPTGGSIFFIASVLLIVATALELPLLGDPTDHGGPFWPFVLCFGLAAIGYLIGSLLLAFGTRPVTGSSPLAKVGLAVFGVFWLIAQTLYLVATYFARSEALRTVSTILSLVMILGGLAAGVVIAVRGTVTGIARWSLLVGVIVSGVTGAIAAGGSAGLVTTLHLISAIVLALVGCSYLLSSRAAQTSVATGASAGGR